MPNYQYEAIAGDGEVVTGEIAAPRVSDAIAQLEAQGLQVESIRALVTTPDSSATKKAFYDRIDQALQTREKLIPALEALADEMPDRNASRDVRKFTNELKSGVTAEQFVKRDSMVAWLPLVVRGLECSSAEDRYSQLMGDATRESDNRRRLRTVIAYPLFLLMFGGIILMLLVLFVVPVFARMFAEFGLLLPAPTRFLFWISDQLSRYSLRSMLFVALFFGLVIVLCRLWIRLALSTSILGMFTAGNSANVTAMAKFTGSLAELMSIEAPLPEALRIAGRACDHRHFRIMAERMANELEIPGKRLRDTSAAHNFPATMRHALGNGRNCAPNVPLLRELSRMYSDRARERVNWSTNILGPISLIVLGLVIGFVIIALFMPLVSLVTSLA
ncbi:MAG: type II secretion system F family protein [Pirellulaceae bacterium]|nr:type II secretion system F family protein [Pirellulaceae bacterium]